VKGDWESMSKESHEFRGISVPKRKRLTDRMKDPFRGQKGGDLKVLLRNRCILCAGEENKLLAITGGVKGGETSINE